MNMRVLIVLLMFAIGFSGFSTTAHAFSDVLCDSGISQQMDSDSECADHQMAPDVKKDTGGELAAKDKCIDCMHCCSGHVYSLTVSVLPMQAIFVPVTYPVLTDRIAGDYAFSLLRPPQFAA